MVNTFVVQGCIVCTAKQNVTLHEFPKQRSLWRRFVQTTRSLWEPTHHSHVCSQRFVSLDFVNDVEYQKGYAKKRVISKTAVPTIFPSKLSDSQRSVGGLGGNVPWYCSVRVLRLILLLLHTFSQCRWCSWWLVHVWFYG